MSCLIQLVVTKVHHNSFFEQKTGKNFSEMFDIIKCVLFYANLLARGGQNQADDVASSVTVTA